MSVTASQLKSAVNVLSQAPFNKTVSTIELHDDYSLPQLLSLITEVMAILDSDNVNSWHKNVDIRYEDPQDTIIRMADFLQMLNFKDASDFNAFQEQMLSENKNFLLSILVFILSDVETFRKRCYLYQFLHTSVIPQDLEQDEDIIALNQNVIELQTQFKETHKFMESVRPTGSMAANLKLEIQQMEDEKQQLMAKISRIKSKVDGFPKKELWLQKAKNLRLEQKHQMEIADRIQEQKNLMADLERKWVSANEVLRETKALFITGGPEAYLSKMEEDMKTNKYLATENLPSVIRDLNQQLQDLIKVVMEPNITEEDIKKLEKELKFTNEAVAKMTEKRMNLNTSGDAKLSLFRQQSVIIGRKKAGTAAKLAEMQDLLSKLQSDLESKQTAANNNGSIKMLKGEEFKKYVNELRAKSNIYKAKKGELTCLSTELAILNRTIEILSSKEQALSQVVQNFEKKMGIVGFHETKDTLEKISEKKERVDNAKGKTLAEISSIVSELINTIELKKANLAPVIQELRQVRQENQELETKYLEKKRLYDITLSGLDGESHQLEQEVKSYQHEILNEQSRYNYLEQAFNLIDAAQDRVLNEMKAYVNSTDSTLESIQASRGFKSYHDLYRKKIMDAEHATKNLKETQKQVKNSHERNLEQCKMFADLKKLLTLKVMLNQANLASNKEEIVLSTPVEARGDRKMPRNWRVGISDPYASSKGLIRMSWDLRNTYNLAQLKLLNLSRMTVYQQRWKAKKVLRAYHFPLVLIRQFVERHFKTQLPTQMLSRADQEKVPPMQSLTFAEIERRLDTVVFRSHFAKSIFGARRAVVMGQVTVNGIPCRYPGWRLEDGDMITVNPRVIPTLSKPKTQLVESSEKSEKKKTYVTDEIMEFKPLRGMAPWMFTPVYLHVDYQTCSTVFLRSPLPQPGYVEIPSPFPPSWHQLVHDWYADIAKKRKKIRSKIPLRMNGQLVKLKPKYDRMVRREMKQKMIEHAERNQAMATSEMKIMTEVSKQMRIDESALDPIYFRNYKATQRVLQKPQISQMASRLKSRLSLAITKVALGLEDYSMRQISAHLSCYHDALPTPGTKRTAAQPTNASSVTSSNYTQNKAPIGVFHPPTAEPNNVYFEDFEKSYFASNWDIENIPQIPGQSNISDEIIFQFIHDN